MEKIDYFNFENKDRDFPIYRDNPHLSKAAWVVLFISLFIGMLFISDTSILSSLVSCLIILVPLIYYLNGDYGLIFARPKLNDILLAVGLFIGYIIYALIMIQLLSYLSFVNPSESMQITLMAIPPMVISLLTEELIKFVPFIFFLSIFYKYSNNRKLSIILSAVLVMALFGSLHVFSMEDLLFVLMVQGLGSIFEFIGYIKTKNLWVSYITHVCTDVFIVLISLGI